MTRRANPIGFLKEIEKLLRAKARSTRYVRVERSLTADDLEMKLRFGDERLWYDRVRHGLVFGRPLFSGEDAGSFDTRYVLKVWTETSRVRVRFWDDSPRDERLEAFAFPNMMLLDKSGVGNPVMSVSHEYELPRQVDQARTEIDKLADRVFAYWAVDAAAKLRELQEVRIEFPADAETTLRAQKFAVVRVEDRHGNAKQVLWSFWEAKYHSEICQAIADSLASAPVKVRCVGGGYLDISLEEKTIRAYGRSNTFGREPDRADTIRLLKSQFPDYDVVE